MFKGNKMTDIHSFRTAAGIDIVVVAVVLTDRGGGGGVNVAHAIFTSVSCRSGGCSRSYFGLLLFFKLKQKYFSQWHQICGR